ncbi:hypothetical protein C8R41DRAFT_872184 [Lentinula lateritia]|uniref:Uncharacterized protein n=1 Tax=Lentinula lateritia TaxID=40482 RepID=A0ABQ8UY58_9AGAR|nr:hypothetical protein C8R41DRAFT_872184 [Lentinula lateritia]
MAILTGQKKPKVDLGITVRCVSEKNKQALSIHDPANWEQWWPKLNPNNPVKVHLSSFDTSSESSLLPKGQKMTRNRGNQTVILKIRLVFAACGTIIESNSLTPISRFGLVLVHPAMSYLVLWNPPTGNSWYTEEPKGAHKTKKPKLRDQFKYHYNENDGALKDHLVRYAKEPLQLRETCCETKAAKTGRAMRRKLGKDIASLSIGTDVDVEFNEEGEKELSSDRERRAR